MTARILIVDDIEANRRLLQAKLEAQYHTVLLAENGPQALEMASRELPEIILLDVMMPGMDGYEVCTRLKADPATSYIPVVMVTALSEMEDRVKGLDAGAEDFLTKPVDDFLLNSRITALMRYNTVAAELRQREASGLRSGAMEEASREEIDRPARVFIVDDDPRSSTRLASMLRAQGHKATTLLEAGNMGDLAAERVDVVIVSLFCRSFDPLKLCAHFKVNPVTRSISVIVVCDPHDKAKALRALEIGASDTITVPLDKQELAARIRTQTRRTRYIDILRQRVDRGLELSVIDQLTGLHNRRYMNGQLEQLMQRSVRGGKPLSLMMTDIDHFKSVNDTHGHQAGDDVLREIAKRLRANVRPTDIVCRTGGEEFVVVMPDTPGDLACAAAERIRKSVAAEEFPVLGGSRNLRITVSAGVSTLQGATDTIDELLHRADTALYQAKTGGRNRVESIAA
ncbi:PleD family two-component system response regulator [Hyphomonas sp. WL0036]|uniref:PleD family two-component system response regulator n=1 Tax=Hyphomonas sediminis TaxID=2866160 RepID=UPI001C7E6DDE|nr:PleD family two-component system response regulator [Hyphomonas sediminis]MBY9067119.1 PleD family two-component system response regulator [Hyphomonas sediminis]